MLRFNPQCTATVRHNTDFYNPKTLYSIHLSISLLSCSHGKFPKGDGHSKSVSNSPCSGTPSQNIPSLTCPLIHAIDPFHWQCLPYTPSLSPTLIHSLHKVILVNFYHIPSTLSVYHYSFSVSLITHSATPQFTPGAIPPIPSLPYVPLLISVSHLDIPRAHLM